MTTPRIAFIAAACLLAGSTAFAQVPPPPPGGPVPPPPLGATAPEAGTVASGRVQQWLINPSGEADGLLLNDGTQVAFPPHLSAAVMQMLKPGDTVHVSGWRAPNVPVVRMQSLVANGRSLVDQPPAPGMAAHRRDVRRPVAARRAAPCARLGHARRAGHGAGSHQPGPDRGHGARSLRRAEPGTRSPWPRRTAGPERRRPHAARAADGASGPGAGLLIFRPGPP